MKQTLNLLLLIIFVSSCCEQTKIKPETPTPTKVVAKGYKVPKDSIKEPKTVLINNVKLKKTPVKQAKNITTNLNIHVAKTPKIIAAKTIKKITLGTNTVPLPKITSAIDSPFVAKQPKSVAALPFRMKDAATQNIQYLDVDQGISSSYIMSIIEDKKGNIWIGTDGGGVSKYNGNSFTHYTEKEGLSSNYIRAILEDKKGNLWLGTYANGVTKYDGKSFTHYTEKEGLSNNNVWAILEDKKGNLWFATHGGGVNKYDGKSFTHYTEREGLSSNFVLSILEDKSGNIWIGTDGKGVSKYDGKSFTNYTEEEGLSSNFVLSILEDKSGNIWFGTYGGGVCKFNENYINDILNQTNLYAHNEQDIKNKKNLIKTFTHYTEEQGLNNNTVISILEDKNGNIWLTTNGGGISKFNGDKIDDILNKTNIYQHNQQENLIKSFTSYTEKEGLSNNDVRAILQDESETIWLGTYGGGLCKYDKNSFSHYTEKEGLNNNNVLSILEDKNNNLWFGTYGGGVTQYNGLSFTHYTEKEGLSSADVRAILEDRKGNLWFSTYGSGVCKYDGKFFTNYTEKEGLSNNTILSILEDKKGNIWFGSNGSGVSKYDGHSFTNYTTKEGLSGNTVSFILEDKKNNIWFGTNGGGVTQYNRNSFTHYTKKEGLSSNAVLTILEDKKGNIWFGTNGGGINKYNGQSFTYYTEKEGLSNNYIKSISEDKNGNLWISTKKGLNCFVTQEEKATNPLIIEFHQEDGLKAEDFFLNSVFVDSKNRIWWGSGKALSTININNFKLNTKVPQIQLKEIYLQDNFIDYRAINTLKKTDTTTTKKEKIQNIKFTSVCNFYNYPTNLELPYYLNHLTFYFSAIDWYSPHKIKYQYKLEELDENWNNLTTDNKADYRNIPYGKYTFKVKAIGSANKWSQIFEYTFIIYAPWWHTWWAYTIYALLITIVIIFIVWWNGRVLHARAKELEIKINEATIGIKEQKNLVEKKHKEITDSINYAERIQRALLANKNLLDINLSSATTQTRDYFVLFKPKDIVSGDFYWAKNLTNNNFALVVADSTGHGVPGSIMSILNMACLDKAITKGITSPNLILNETRKLIIESLKNDGSIEGGKDGMDAALLSFDFKSNTLNCACANNPIWIIREKKLIEIKPDRFPIGKHDRDSESFTLRTFKLQKKDIVYILTDGFSDQFGGLQGKKLKNNKIKETLLAIAHEPLFIQKQKLNSLFEEWKGSLDQVDDVTVVAIQI